MELGNVLGWEVKMTIERSHYESWEASRALKVSGEEAYKMLKYNSTKLDPIFCSKQNFDLLMLFAN